MSSVFSLALFGAVGALILLPFLTGRRHRHRHHHGAPVRLNSGGKGGGRKGR